MAGKYLPLEIMDCVDEIESQDIFSYVDLLSNQGFNIKNEEEYIDKLLRLHFARLEKYEAKRLVTSLMTLYGEALEQMGVLKVGWEDKGIQYVLVELYDIILRPYIMHHWKRNKQVYKPDKDFSMALLKTENLSITKEVFDHLPCKHFYIDVSDCNLFCPIEGVFVDLFEIDNGYSCVIHQCSKEAFWSSYDFIDFDLSKQKEFKVEDYTKNNTEYSFCETDKNLSNKETIVKENGLNRDEASFFVYQLITYLSSHEPQFEESSITKSTYRPPKTGNIKNKFSEIQMHDIGIKFGKSFREQKRKYKCNTILTKHLEYKRKSPIPHFRSAHWQRYWVGKGRTKQITKWIEPIFVGGGESSDVTIHKM